MKIENKKSMHTLFPQEYRAWSSMKHRCLCKSCADYPAYGGRGIGVHKPWIKSFVKFLNSVGLSPSKNHSLDRINNDGNYKPSNVRWATKREQKQNSRNNRNLTFRGITECISEWDRKMKFKPGLIGGRLRAGWTIEEAMTTPIQKHRKTVKK